MRGFFGRVGVLLILVAALPAAAAPRLAVGPVRGDAKRAVSRQLEKSLCRTFECQPWSDVSRKGKLDLSLVRRHGVGGVLLGSISTRGGKVLTLDLFTRSPKPARTWRLPLGARGLLDADSLDLVRRELSSRFDVAAPAPAPQPARPAAPVPLPPPPASRPQADTWREVPPPSPGTPAYAPAPAPESRPVHEPEPSAAEPAGGQWLVAAELGGFFAKRDLTFSGSAAGPLLEHHAPGMAGIAARVELFPAASLQGPLRSIGLSVAYARSMGLQTQDSAGMKHGTTATRLGAGLLWRAPALTSVQLVLVPSLGYESRQVTVSPLIDGLPDAKLTGLRAGLGLEVPLASRFTLLAEVAYVYWMTARELVKGSPAFFPGGSAFGIDAECGLAVRVWGPVSVRALGGYNLTSYTLKVDPTGTYSASGAKDASLGARAVLRAEY